MELHERNFSFHHIIITEFHDGEDVAMQMNEAIIKRINEICEEKSINICDASLKGGMSPSAIYDLIKGRTKCSKVITVKRFCERAGSRYRSFSIGIILTKLKNKSSAPTSGGALLSKKFFEIIDLAPEIML